MKSSYILSLLSLAAFSQGFATDYYGYIVSLANSYPNSTLYFKNTDPRPGKVNNNDGAAIVAVNTGQTLKAFNDVAVPWDKFGGKIYIWLVENVTGKIISSALLFDKDDAFHFLNDRWISRNGKVQEIERQKIQCNESWQVEGGIAGESHWGSVAENSPYGPGGIYNQMHNALISISASSEGVISAGFSCDTSTYKSK